MAALAVPTLRTSERATFKRCAWKWLQEFRYGYRPKGIQADALWFGIGIHEALAPWYQRGTRRGPHPADTWHSWVGDEVAFAKTYLDDTYDSGVWEDAAELGEAMLEGYVDKYGKDSQWSIISIEQPFSVNISRHGKVVAVFKSRWDGVLRNLADGKIYLLENKTASQISTAYLELDDQGGSYWAVASAVLRAKGVLKPGEEIAGIIYNFLRKTKPDDRPQDAEGLYHNKPVKEDFIEALRSIGAEHVEQSSPKSGPIDIEKATLKDLEAATQIVKLDVLGEVSKKQPPPAFLREVIMRSAGEQKHQLERIADEVEVMNAVRSGLIPVTKTPTKDCPRCPFWTPCTLHERGSSAYKTVLRANFEQIDPYADNRKSAAERMSALCLQHDQQGMRERSHGQPEMRLLGGVPAGRLGGARTASKPAKRPWR